MMNKLKVINLELNMFCFIFDFDSTHLTRYDASCNCVSVLL